MLDKLRLLPPLAFARVGPSEVPCDAFLWGPNDLRPRGTGKTTLVPRETLRVAADGSVDSGFPDEVRVKDASGFRPVCPFFELHGEWTEATGESRSGAVTLEILERFGLSTADLAWRIEAANLKAFHYTLEPGDRIETRLEVAGGDTTPHELQGRSPAGVGAGSPPPLLPADRSLPLGTVQLTQPTVAFPEIRLRVVPAAGHVYGPEDLPTRSTEYDLPPECLLLDSRAAWCRFVPQGGDGRTNPSGLYATDSLGVSLGLIDDTCDGIIRCSLGENLVAHARFTVGPPDFAPDRRPFTSVADGLADRTRREDVSAPDYFEDAEAVSREVADLFERILETLGLMNLDFQNLRARGENRGIALSLGQPPEDAENRAFPASEPVTGEPLPLTDHARRMHRRLPALEVLEDMLRERPQLLEQIVRPPMTGDRYYDRRMPPLMRGSDRYPMHVTRRQYEMLRMWVIRLRRGVEGGS